MTIERLNTVAGRREELAALLTNCVEDEIERLAREYQRTLLVLDTRTGDTASLLYRRCQYIEVGQIPGYARSARGTLDGTTYFYKQL